MQLPIIKNFVLYLFSFTNNNEYKIAYIEFLGVLVGSFIAIYGALWVQRKINKNVAINEQKKYARIAYYDFYFAFNDLLKMYDDTKRKYNIKSIDGEENVEKFCNGALGRNLYLNPTWISDTAQLGETLTNIELTLVYKYYGKLVNIDRALQSGEVNSIKNIYVSDIAFFIDEDNKKIHSDCGNLLKKLNAIFNDVNDSTH